MTPRYTPVFTPPVQQPAAGDTSTAVADRTPEATYVFSEPISLAVNVTLATGRPLIVRGPSGAGKTSLARAVASALDCTYLETVVTGRTQARDLLWTTDQLSRLQDAQQGRLSADWRPYVLPGPLWWAFDYASAREQLLRARPSAQPGDGSPDKCTLLLIDEIDKADPDVPNSLLRPIGDLAFEVEETGQRVDARSPVPIILITTNEERDLPGAFLRRCVELNIPPFKAEDLIDIGAAHYPTLSREHLGACATLVINASQSRRRVEPNPAEYLDVLRACRELNIDSTSPEFRQLVAVALGGGTGA